MNNQNAQSPAGTDKPQESSTEDSRKKRKMIIIIAGISAVILLCIIAVLCVFFWNNYQGDDNASSSSSTTSSSSSSSSEASSLASSSSSSAETVTKEVFNGDYLMTEILPEWTITEYEDGAGTDLLVSETTYDGLTGVAVLNADGDEVFTIKAISGIGGISVCDTIYTFPDTSAAYKQELLDSATAYYQDLGEDGPDVVNMSNDYTEFTLLDVPVRRVDTQLFWDVDESPAFNPACGISEQIYQFPNLTFQMTFPGSADSVDASSYWLEITDGTSEADLLILDDILENLTLQSN